MPWFTGNECFCTTGSGLGFVCLLFCWKVRRQGRVNSGCVLLQCNTLTQHSTKTRSLSVYTHTRFWPATHTAWAVGYSMILAMFHLVLSRAGARRVIKVGQSWIPDYLYARLSNQTPYFIICIICFWGTFTGQHFSISCCFLSDPFRFNVLWIKMSYSKGISKLKCNLACLG